MFVRWSLEKTSTIRKFDAPKIYPMVFSIHEDEVNKFLDWMREHDCEYSSKNKTRDILKGYTNEEIIKNGLVSMVFEQYGNDGSKCEGFISIILMPSVLGTKYILRCKCGEEFEPITRQNIHYEGKLLECCQ